MAITTIHAYDTIASYLTISMVPFTLNGLNRFLFSLQEKRVLPKVSLAQLTINCTKYLGFLTLVKDDHSCI